jgi:DNA-binding transcriptional LysR family regulator
MSNTCWLSKLYNSVMELRQLEYFVRVSEEANFTRAAQQLHVAQPVVSTQIQRLERELGQPLLDRSKRTVRLTSAGAAALPHARAALVAALNVQHAVDETAQLVRGTINIGTVASQSVDIAALITQFHIRYPSVGITLRVSDSDGLVDALRRAELDLALIAVGSDEQPEGIAIKTVSDEAIVAVVARTHPWSRQSAVAVEAMQDMPLIALPQGTEVRRQLEHACRRAGFVPHVAFEVSTPGMMADLCALGLGVGIMRQSLAHDRVDLHSLSIVPEFRARLAMAWRAVGPVSPAARILTDMAQRIAQAPELRA